ncbi:MAG: archease [Elusimicrobia bacterium]|nr:archease [Elusimicrobiota bacterium]
MPKTPNTANGRFRFTEHTSEIGIEIEAPDLNAFFQTAGYGLIKLVLPQTPQGGRVAEKTAALRAETTEELLVAWLNEVVFWIQTQRFVAQNFDLSADQNGTALAVRAKGKSFDRLPLVLEVKAATYQRLKIIRSKNTVKTTVILDI